MKKYWIKKGLMIAIFIIIALLFLGIVVMTLWNAILPAVLGVRSITFVQALGILLLSKILFGGFRGRGFRGSNDSSPWKQKIKDKWTMMTAEEKEQFKAAWKTKCGNKWNMFKTTASNTSQPE